MPKSITETINYQCLSDQHTAIVLLIGGCN